MPRKKREILDELERRIVASDMLSEDDKAEIRERARKEVAETRKKDATEAYLKAAIREEQREFDPVEQLEDFTVDLADYAPYIAINNTLYFHGVTYEVPNSLARCLAEIAQATWRHEREWREGKHRVSMPELHRRMSMRTGAVTSPHGAVTTTGNIRG
jgi:hypothetical protein